MDTVHEHEKVDRVLRLELPFPDLRQYFAGHLGGHFSPLLVPQLVMDVHGDYSPAVEQDDIFLDF